MLDDQNVLKQRDPSGLLEITANQCEQLRTEISVNGGSKSVDIDNVIVASLGGSALAALFVKTWLKNELKVPIEIVRTYDLPDYVNSNSLVIACSYSGSTEEVISCYNQAKEKNAVLSVIASGGKLIEHAKNDNSAYVILPSIPQPRMGVISNIRAIVALMVNFGLISSEKSEEIVSVYDWLKAEIVNLASNMPTDQNYAKMLAQKALGKTSVFYGGPFAAAVANKFKISLNENAKNIAFFNEYPEMNHNEFSGWTSHPIEKPFAVFDVISDYEHPQILKRFEVTDRILSGMRPKSITISLKGETEIKQLLWGNVLADFVGVYLGILNNTDPMPVPYVDKLKSELN